MRHSTVPLILSALLVSAAVTACGGDEVGALDGDARSGGAGVETSAADSIGSQGEPPAGSEGSADRREALRVVVLGTSLTAGLGLPDPGRQSWAHVVEREARAAGYAVDVVNAGVSGDTSAGGLRRLDWLLRERVDVLVVELGANDGLRGLSVEEMESNLRRIITLTRRAWPEARIVLAGMEAPPNLGRGYVAAFREVFVDIARDEDVGRIPFLLEGVAAVPSLNQADGIHPTVEGHERMARTAWPTIEAALREALSGGRP